jgi:cytochrome P450
VVESQEMIARFDIFSEEVAANFGEIFKFARENCPVIHAEVDGGYYVPTRYDDIKCVLSDAETFSSAWGTPRGALEPPINIDGAAHRDYRMLLNRFFSYRVLELQADQIRGIANGFIDQWANEGHVEFMSGFASGFTASVLSNVIFNDPDSSWTSEPQRLQGEVAPSGGLEQVFDATRAVARQRLEERLESDEEYDDVMSAVINGTIDGRPLRRDEQIGTLCTLFLGGLNTTRALLGGTMQHVARRPELEDLVRSIHWSDKSVDEFVREISPVAYLGRVVTKPTELGGVSLEPGDHLMIPYSSANHDESVFGNEPEVLSFDRDKNPHVGFGHGVHRCIGLPLARVNFAIAMQQIFDRITNVRLEAEPVHTAGLSHGPHELFISFDLR